MKAPFPYFGGKSRVAADVWHRFGNVPNYIEPFAGSLAVLLARPDDHAPFRVETVNDADGFVSNFWRAVSKDPDAVAQHADWPVNENDLHARHAWLIDNGREIVAKLEDDPEFFDARIAGWWVWGRSCWIGGGWGSVKYRRIPYLGSQGIGVHAARCRDIRAVMCSLQARLRRVRVCSGDWTRVCSSHSTTTLHGVTGVFLDPPYADTAGRCADLYARDSMSVAHAAREWAIANGDNPLFRIALCGYEGEHEMPDTWECFAWKAHGGYAHLGDGAGRENARRERIWFSPHCERERGMF